MSRNVTIVVIILIIVLLAAYLVWLRGRYTPQPIVNPTPEATSEAIPSLSPKEEATEEAKQDEATESGAKDAKPATQSGRSVLGI